MVEPRRVDHRHLGSEAAIAQIGPVTNFAIANTHDVGEAVAREIGQIDGLRNVSEDDARTFFLVESLRDAPGWAEALFSERGVPDESVVFGDEHIGVAVTVQIDELEVRVAHVEVQARGEGAEWLPTLRVIVFIQAGGGAFRDNHVRLAVAGQVHELRATAQDDVGFEGDGFERGELRLHDFAAVGQLDGDRAPVALVEPGAGRLGEDTGDAFAVQVGPAVRVAVQADGKIFEALRINILDRALHDRFGVRELNWRQAAPVVAAVFAAVAGLRD